MQRSPASHLESQFFLSDELHGKPAPGLCGTNAKRLSLALAGRNEVELADAVHVIEPGTPAKPAKIDGDSIADSLTSSVVVIVEELLGSKLESFDENAKAGAPEARLGRDERGRPL